MTRRRVLFLLPAVAAAAAGVSFAFFHHPDGWPSSWPELRAATAATGRIETTVGPNVLVSRSLDGHGHMECVIAADPNDPRRLFASAMFERKDGGDTSIAGYYSHDGGGTWAKSYDADPARPGERLGDETLAYGPDGELYLAHMRFRNDGTLVQGQNDGSAVEFHRSTDGGVIWEKRGVIDRHIDRPWVAVDRTTGPYRGRLYWSGNIHQPIFGASADGGAVFLSTLTPQPELIKPRPSTPVVLSDGAVVFVHRHDLLRRRLPQLRVFRSDDGGATAREVGRVQTRWRHGRLAPGDLSSSFDHFPQLAVAPSGSRTRDRLYCVWIDGTNNIVSRVVLSWSDDRGATWTPPIVISEQSMDDDSNDYNVGMPTVAVNPAGVVAVCWYDARGFPNDAMNPQKETAGYNVRMRVSADGGETWAPSVQVNEAPARADVQKYGHTAGLAAAADGRFFPAWIDDRTGRPQLWVAACAVRPAE